jgi:ADP-ribose pyrophosphatase
MGVRKVIPLGAKLVPPNAKRVFKGVIYDTYQWLQELYDGTEEIFEMLKRPDTVKVIAVKDNQIVIVDQVQPYHGHFYDIPGGMHDNDTESELEAAQRELLEETGMRFKTWRLLECTQLHNKIEQFVYVFLATDFESQSKQQTDSGEKIAVKLMSFEKVKALVDSPKSRYLPKDILWKTSSIEELLNLQTFEGQVVD